MKTILVFLLFVLVLLQLRLWTGPGSIADIARLESEIVKQSDENGHLEARNSVLMDEVSDLRNGLDSIEERARSELGLIREGETFYLIVEKDPNARESSIPAEPAILPAIPEPAAEPPEAPAADANPYLEIFRDDDGTPEQARSADPQAAARLAAGQ